MKQFNESVIKAAKLYDVQNYSETIDILNKYLQIEEDSEAYNLRGMTHFASGNLELAFEDLNRAVFLEPANTTFLNNLGIAYLNSDVEKALKTFQKILQSDENAFETYKTLGMYYFQNGFVKEAMNYYEKLIQKQQIDFNVASNYAQLLFDIGEYGHSIQYINNALNIDSNNPYLHLQKADVLSRLECPAEATTTYKKFLSLTNRHMDTYIFSKIKKSWSNYAAKYYRFHKIKEKSYREAYLQAIQNSVKNKVVLEYGRNGGLFAMIAADAGAKKVYVCENDKSIAAQIKEVIETNSFGNIIEVIETTIYKIEDLQADVAIIERFGNYIVDENIMTDIEYIKNNLLINDGEIIPKKASLYGMTVNTPMLQEQDYSYNMKGFSIYEAPYIEKNINALQYTKTSETFKIFDFNFYDPKTLNTILIEPSYIAPSSDAIVIWFQLDFGNTRVENLTEQVDYFEQLIWPIEKHKNSSLEFINEKDILFVNTIS